MSIIRKRKLTSQQVRRIDEQQRHRQQDDTDENTLEGLIVAHYGRQLEVQALNGAGVGDIWRCHTRTNLPALVTGDRVRWQADSNTQQGIITAVHPRDSLLTRPDRYHKIKPVAANVQLIVVMFAAEPVPSPQLIDRYLVACHAANIPCLLALNKADLLTAEDPLLDLLAEYQALGYPTLVLESTGDLSPLTTAIAGKTVVFVGQSGVGKSSVINTLIPDAAQRVNIISNNSLLGQHTTTSTRLMTFEHDGHTGALIDSPGIRQFGLWHLSREAIHAGFIELAPFMGLCKFRNCNHRQAQGCALYTAVAEGAVLLRRLHSLHKLEDELSEATKEH